MKYRTGFYILVVAYFLGMAYQPEPNIRLIIKCLPIVVLILWAWDVHFAKTRLQLGIFIGFLFSVMGDAFLVYEGYFLPGLGSFLVAQLIYTITMSLGQPLHLIRAIPFLGFAVAMFLWLQPSLGAFQIPVGIYITAIAAMGWRAASRSQSNKTSYVFGLLAALVFLVSDSLIAIGKFTDIAIPHNGEWIMLTYYIAQFFFLRMVARQGAQI